MTRHVAIRKKGFQNTQSSEQLAHIGRDRLAKTEWPRRFRFAKHDALHAETGKHDGTRSACGTAAENGDVTGLCSVQSRQFGLSPQDRR